MSVNEYEAREETKQQAHQNAVQELAVSRQRAKNAITAAEAAGIPPFVSVANNTPPDPINQRSDRPSWETELRLLHAATLEFAGEVHPYRDRAKDKWEADFELDVRIPEEDAWKKQERRQMPDVEQRGLTYNTTRLSLDSLRDWRFRQVTLATRYASRNGSEEVIRRIEKVYLPPAVAHCAFEALNEILSELKLAAEVRAVTDHDYDPGKPDDWGEWD